MKHFLRSGVLWLMALNAITQGFAQDSPPPPPPDKDYFPERWQEYAFPDSGFKIKLPGEPQQAQNEVARESMKLAITTVKYGSAAFISYAVNVTAFPANLEDTNASQKIFAGVREAALKQTNSQLVSENAFTLDGHPGQFLHTELEKRTVLRAKTVIVRGRLFQAVVMTPIHGPERMGSANGYEKIAMSFLDSFGLLKVEEPKSLAKEDSLPRLERELGKSCWH